MKCKAIIFLTLLLNFSLILKAQEFSTKDKAIIYTNAIEVLEKYETITNQIGEFIVSDVDKAKSNAESLLELFANRQVLIFNDLDPSHKLSEFYEAETYSSNIILWYPDGISVQLDLGNARVSDIMTHEADVFSLDILVNKSINGNYLNETMNKNVEELLFRIAFGLENKSLVKFKIVGIRSTTSDYVIDYTQALKQVISEDFSADDLVKVQTELKTLLQDYTNFLSLIGDPQELPDDKEFYKTSFLNLFLSPDTRIYNDINPEPETSLISLNDYLAGFVADYPNGIRNLSINTDSAKFGQIMKDDEGSYYTFVDADKFFSGSFKGRDVFRNSFPLFLKVSFKAAGNTYTDFKINSIDISSVNFYEAAPGDISEEKPQIIIRPVTRKGLAMSFIASVGQTQINNKNITTLSVDSDLHSWNSSHLYGYLTAIGISYYFNDNIAARSGIEFNTYSEKFNLRGTFENNTLSRDINYTSYYKIIAANYDSLVSIKYLTLPIMVNYTSGKPGKLGFYGEGGVKISIPVRASYSLSGDYKTSGRYPTNPVSIQVLDLTELGFYERHILDETGDLKMKGFNLAFYSSAGINIPLGYYSSINVGPEMIIGISDILSNKKNYIDIFGKTYPHQPTKIKNFGIRISFAYKL